MTVQTLRDELNAKPFEGFRVTMSSGEKFEVRHPEMAYLTRTDLIVGLDERDGIPARYRILSLLHVTAIEPVDAPAGTSVTAAA